MLTAVKGTFRNGHVELDEDPGVTGEVAVVVTFLNTDLERRPAPRPVGITFGMLAQRDRRMSDLGDFRIAEHGDGGDDEGSGPVGP